MTMVVALSSIEGSRKSDNPVIAPGSVFDADADLLKHLQGARAVRPASKEDVALAKAKGMFIELTKVTGSDDAAQSLKDADADADKADSAAAPAATKRAANKSSKSTKGSDSGTAPDEDL